MSALFVPAGIIGSILGGITSVATAPLKAAASVGLSAVSTWIVAGAELMLHEVVTVISLVTTPSLSVSWFSGSYWRVSALAMLLTVPFLFAAAVQAVLRTDMGVLIRAAFFDLPIAAIAVTLAAPLITLLLAATDEMCTLVTGSGRQGGPSFLDATASDLAAARGSAMLAVIAVLILLAGLVLAVELIMRSAAIYIVVLFLPLGFAAMVWPARRVWIKRMIELLIALILSKFAMVAILSVAVAALTSAGSGGSSFMQILTAMALLILAAFSPWALLRLLPFTELAAGAGAMLHHETKRGMGHGATTAVNAADVAAGLVVDPAVAGFNVLRNFANDGSAGSNGRTGSTGPTSLTRNRGGELPPGPASPSDPGPAGTDGPFGSSGGGGVAVFPNFDGEPAGQVAPNTGPGLQATDGRMPDGASPPSSGPTAAGSGGGVAAAEAARIGGAAQLAPGPSVNTPRGLVRGSPPNDRARAVREAMTETFGEEDDPVFIGLSDSAPDFVIRPQSTRDLTPENGSDDGSGE